MELREAIELAKRWRESWMVETDRRLVSTAPQVTDALALLIDAAEKSPPPPDAAIVERCAQIAEKDWLDDNPKEYSPRMVRERIARKIRALVSPTMGEGKRCTCDYDHVNDDEHRPWCGGPQPEAKDGGAKG